MHSVVTSAASVADKHMLPDLLHGEERKVWGDGGYQGQTEVRYRGIWKNHQWLCAAFALVNLYQHRNRLAPRRA